MKCRWALTVVLYLLLPAIRSFAQSSQPNLPECQPAALDATLAFANQADEHVVAVNYRNLSESACVLNGGIGAMFDNWHEGHNIWAKECRNCDAGGTGQPVAPLKLAPGESGHFLLRWKKVAIGSQPCEDSDGFNTNNVTVVAPSLLDHVCSVVDERSFLPGTFPSGAEDAGGSAVAESLPSIELSAPDSTLYGGDSFPFRALIRDPNRQVALDDQSCPLAFIRTRDVNGSVMFHQLSVFSPRCKADGAGTDRKIELEVRAPGLGVLLEPGPRSVEFFVLAGPRDAPAIALASSNSLAMKIVDPATIPPVWGPEAAGIAISLVLDKESYKSGEDIPLRINLENFRAPQEIASGELPCLAGVTIEVRDSSGTPVPEHGFGWLCTGHGWQMAYPVGKPILVPRISLRAVSLLPDQPGTYTVTATWNAMSFASKHPEGIFGRPLKPYAVVKSRPVTFRILEEPY